MDAKRFDSLTKTFASSRSRRSAFKTIAGAVVGAGAFARSSRLTQATDCSAGYTFVSVIGNRLWTDTGIDAAGGNWVDLKNREGLVYIAGSDPGKTVYGDPNCVADDSYPLPGNGCWQLIGRIGSSGPIRLSGGDGGLGLFATPSGRVYLGVNDDFFDDNSGSWQMCVGIDPDYCGHLNQKFCNGQCIPLNQQCGGSGDACGRRNPCTNNDPCANNICRNGKCVKSTKKNGEKCGKYSICLDGYCQTAKEGCVNDALTLAANGHPFKAVAKIFGKRCSEAARETFFEIVQNLCEEGILIPDTCGVLIGGS